MPFPIELQGDSRQFAALVGEAGACVSSPPFAQAVAFERSEHRIAPNSGGPLHGEWGTDPANLGNMKAGDFDACLASPPYAESLASDDPDKRGGLFHDPKRHGDKTLTATYGQTDGQLGAMPAGGFEAAVSSPPYDTDTLSTFSQKSGKANGTGQIGRGEFKVGRCLVEANRQGYSLNADNLGNATDFWTAARTIVEQVYTVLRPGAHAIWVLKAYVRDRKIVDFPDQWRQMCEACGFETLHVHRAWLVEDHGAQATLDGGVEKREKRRVSFFRRLHMKKYPHLAIDYEIVLCMRKGNTQ